MWLTSFSHKIKALNQVYILVLGHSPGAASSGALPFFALLSPCLSHLQNWALWKWQTKWYNQKTVPTVCAIARPLWTTGCARAALGADSPDWPQFINCSFKKWLKIPAEGLRNTPENGSTSWPCGQQGVCFLHVCFQGLLVTSQNEQNLKTFGLPSLKISCSKALLGLLPPLDLGYHPDGLKCSCSEKTRWQWHIQ